MKLKVIVIIVLSLVVLIAVITGEHFYNMKVPGLNGIEAEYTLTADGLYNAFEEDEAKAMSLYEGKVISVNGEVISIKESENGMNVTLKAEKAMLGGINCSFDDTKMKLSKGENATIKGRCQGFLMDVVLNNCVIDE